MKKHAAVLVASVGALMMLVGCSTPSTASSAPASSAAPVSSEPTPVSSEPTSIPDDQKITITYESTTGKTTQPYLEAYIAEFNAKYPQYKAVPSYYSGSYTALEQDVIKGFSAGNYPDLVQCYPDHVAEYLSYGKAVELNQFIDSSDANVGLTADEKADYITAFMKEGQQYSVAGTYSLPNCKSTELMFWNKDVLQGLVLNQTGHVINEGKALGQTYFDNLTWEELFDNFCPAIAAYNDSLAADKKILKTDQDYHSIFAYDSDDNLFITLAEQYGYAYTSVNQTTGKGSADFNNANMLGLMKKFNAAANAGYIISKGSAGGNYTNTYFTKQNTLFSVGSTGGVKYQFSSSNPMDVGVARIPHAAGKDPKVISQGPSVCVLSHGTDETSKLKAKGAYLLWKTMTTAKNSLNWGLNSGYMPVRTSNYSDQEYITANDETAQDLKTAERLMARSATYSQKILGEMYSSPVFVGSSACRSAGSAIMTFALTQNTAKGYTDAEWQKEFDDMYAAAVKEIR
jgi:multiple sugar transport system substrate-binding protein